MRCACSTAVTVSGTAVSPRYPEARPPCWLTRRYGRSRTILDIWLVFALLKRDTTDLTVQKATELGVAALLPVFTERTNAARVNEDRLRATAIEAAEQSERLTVPLIHPARDLDQVLTEWPDGRPLFVAMERELLPPPDRLEHRRRDCWSGLRVGLARVIVRCWRATVLCGRSRWGGVSCEPRPLPSSGWPCCKHRLVASTLNLTNTRPGVPVASLTGSPASLVAVRSGTPVIRARYR